MQVLSYFPKLGFVKTGFLKKFFHKIFMNMLLSWMLRHSFGLAFAFIVTPHALLSVNVNISISLAGADIFCCI